MYKFLRAHPSLATLNSGIVVFVSLFSLAMPVLFKIMIEGILPDHNLRSFILCAALLAVFTIGRSLFGVIQDYIFLLHRQRIEVRCLQNALYRSDLKQIRIVETFALIRNFVSTFQYFWIQFFFYFGYAAVISAVVLLIFFLIEPVFFYLAAGFTILHALNFLIFRQRVEIRTEKFSQAKAALTSEIEVHFKLLAEIKAQQKEQFLVGRLERLSRQYGAAYLSKELTTGMQRVVQDSLVNIFYIGLFLLALLVSTNREVGMGNAALGIFLAGFVFEPIYRFSAIIKASFEARSYTGWIPAHGAGHRTGSSPASQAVELRLEQVRTAVMVERNLAPLNACLRTGKLYLLSGPSGIGKTTLLDCIAGVDRLASGRIESNIDISSCTSYCEQLAAIFPGDIHENVTFYAPSPLSERALQMLEALDLDGHVERSRTTHSSSQLSGGQKQRLAVARSLLSGAAVKLLDEPTAALDEDNERIVLEYLRQEARSSLVIFISHSPLAKQYADEIINLA